MKKPQVIFNFVREKKLFPLLNNHLYDLSINDLKEFLKKERRKPLSKTKQKQIKKLIDYRVKENIKKSQKWLEFFPTWFAELAFVYLKMMGKAERVRNIHGFVFYNLSIYDFLDSLKRIIDRSELKKLLHLIRYEK